MLSTLPRVGIADVRATPRAPAPAARLEINGEVYQLALEPRVTLLDALREYIGLTGAKKGCDRG